MTNMLHTLPNKEKSINHVQKQSIEHQANWNDSYKISTIQLYMIRGTTFLNDWEGLITSGCSTVSK